MGLTQLFKQIVGGAKKKEITEREAANFYIAHNTKNIITTWPVFYENLRAFFNEEFIIKNEQVGNVKDQIPIAIADMTLAGIAQGILSLRNLFPHDQAERMEKWILETFNNGDNTYMVDEIKAYIQTFQEAVKNVDKGSDPLAAISGRLLYKWFGRKIFMFETGENEGFIDPLLEGLVNDVLIKSSGVWLSIKNNFSIIKENS